MATTIERPQGALNSSQSHSQSSRLSPIEIIDVDLFEEPTNHQPQRPAPASQPQRAAPAPRPESNHRETINLVDSDDDDEVQIVATRIRAGHDVDRHRSHRSFISPAPRDPSAPPPVPAFPRRFSGFTSFPIFQRNQQPLPPVIPLADPLPYERTSVQPVAGPSNATRVVPEGRASSSHATPIMGLGGALTSYNRSRVSQRLQESDSAATSGRRSRRGPMQHYRAGREIVNPFSITDRDDDVYIHMLLNPYIGEGVDFLPPRWRQSSNFIRMPGASQTTDEKYRQNYTHATPPEPGFTFDFALDDDKNGGFFPLTSRDEPIVLDDDEVSKAAAPGPSTTGSVSGQDPPSQLTAVLVCAKCLDPLILNAELPPEEAQHKRVWALRCGHLIDEKCLSAIGAPPVEDPPLDKKGKGKAKAHAYKPVYGAGDTTEAPALTESEPAELVESSIRSRLRSRRSGPSGSDASPQGAAARATLEAASVAPPPALQLPLPPVKKRKGAHRKPKVEAEYQWKCPVAGCGRVHVSVRIEGVWGPEKEVPRGVSKPGVYTEPRGAVAVFA